MSDRRTLLLMRHAKSSWKEAGISDADRPLNKRGKEAAQSMGEYLRQHGLEPGEIVCSNALRAHDTAKRVARAGEFTAAIRVAPALYFAGPSAYLEEIANTGPSVERLLVIGHNPDVESLLARLTGAAEPMPTAAVALITFDLDAWSAIAENPRGTLESVLRPREL